MTENNASKRFFTVSVAVIAVLLVIALIGISAAYLADRGKEDCMIAEDGSYVVCGGEKYVPAGEGFSVDTPTDRIIAENVSIENGDLLDRYFIYGYIIYGNEDASVIYVHTAESSDSAAGYYVKESLTEDIPQKTE